MMTGKRGYKAEDISETLAAVLTREVDWKALPADTPARLKALVRDCLVRDPKERCATLAMHVARSTFDRGRAGSDGSGRRNSAAGTSQAKRLLPWGVAVVAVIAAAASALIRKAAPAAPLAVTRERNRSSRSSPHSSDSRKTARRRRMSKPAEHDTTS